MNRPRERGFVLALTILLVLGVTAISVGILFNGRMGKMSAINYKKKIQTFMAADGMVTLLSQELINGNGSKYVDSTRLGTIQGQIWTGMPGKSVDDFEKATHLYPPSGTIASPYLGSNLNQQAYGIKWTGWIIPPLSGAYTFFDRSDDESRFYLSTDAEESHLSGSPICKQEPGWTIAWPVSGPTVSAPVPLEAGHRYYFEFYHKQGDGWDVGQIGWNGPEFFSERPITGQYLSRYKSDPPWDGNSKVGTVPVHYQVISTGMEAYRIFAEGIQTRPGQANDTAYRLPLTQSLSLKGPAIAPPKNLYLRVIHRDWPSDGSHPEFNMGGLTYGVTKDMVLHTLTDFTNQDAGYFGRNKIPKPTRDPASLADNFSCGLEKWFEDGPDGTVYNYANPHDCSSTTVGGSALYTPKAKIYDSLQFTLDQNEGPNTYVYSRMGNYDSGDPLTSFRGDAEMYFPIDFLGEDPPNPEHHNFGFCTELHTTFVYQSGMKFEFTGDDDVWAFINKQLVIDLGGIHISSNSIVNLDDLTGLNFGQTYDFDFFQCERHQVHSTSRIVTNIKMVPPQGAPVANWHRDYGFTN